MPSLPDSIFLFVLALLLFGPKKLPVLARELGKWIGEFRRASNEFKMQMEEELRLSEQADRLKKLTEMESAAPVAPVISSELPEPEHPHLRPIEASPEPVMQTPSGTEPAPRADGVLPIATSGELSIMPPATGLPVAQSRESALSPLIDSIPAIDSATGENPRENATHGA